MIRSAMTAPEWARLSFALALAVSLAIAGYIAWRASVLQPYSDMYDWIARYYQFRADGDLGRYLLAPHNFHRIAWMFLVLDLDIRFFGAHGYLEVAVALVCLAAVAGMLAKVAAEAAGPGFGLIGGGVAVAISTLGCHLLQAGTHITTPYLHGLVFAVAAIVVVNPEAGASGPFRRLAALGCAVASGLGIATGLAVWPALAFGAYRQRTWPWLAAVVLAAVAFGFLYGLGQPPTPQPLAVAAREPRWLGDAVVLGLSYLGLPWGRAAPGAGVILGAVMLGLSIPVLIRRGGPRAGRSERIAVQLIVFSLGAALLTAIGRAGMAAPQEPPIRYAVFLIPLHVGLWILALPTLRRLWERRPRLGALCLGAASVLLVCHQLVMAVYALGTANAERDQLAAFQAGARTPQMTTTIYPGLRKAEAMERWMARDGLYRR